jgi:hypothetical protein
VKLLPAEGVLGRRRVQTSSANVLASYWRAGLIKLRKERVAMTRKFSLSAIAAAQFLIVGFSATTPARADVPQYFLSQWTVTSNCTEASAGPGTRVQTGLQFKVTSDSAGHYTLQTINSNGRQWASEWNGVKLVYRPGTKMATVPADFECIAGAEESSASASPLLAMSGYVQTAEPQYQQEHFYGLVRIRGELEHVLIFPRNMQTSGGASVIVVLESASAGANITLDADGVIQGK